MTKAVTRYWGRNQSGDPIKDPDGMFVAYTDYEELLERNRMLSAIALSALGLKMQIEMGTKEPSLHALNRDLDAFQARFKSAMPVPSQIAARPANYHTLSEQEQWEIDKTLGILDWEGK